MRIPSRLFLLCLLAELACAPNKRETTDASTDDASTDETTAGAVTTTGDEITGGSCEPVELSPAAAQCAAIVDPAACDAEEVFTDDQKDVLGRCHWAEVFLVDAGCSKVSAPARCVYVLEGFGCGPPESCGDPNFAIYGGLSCNGALELLLSSGKGPYCNEPDGWTACAALTPPPQCTCPCEEGF